MNRTVLRIIDANFNRAREALRVLEEHVRMILDDAPLSKRIKTCRHELVEALSLLDAGALIASRDVPGDIGTGISTPQELTRDCTEVVAVVAAKRACEALRVIEEYGKTLDSKVAGRIESLRYAIYSIEQDIVLGGPRRKKLREARLHVLITASLCKGDWIRVLTAALRGGANAIQLREKQLPDGELLARAKQARTITREHDALLIINDRADIAELADADGVHLGLDDLPVSEVRRMIGPNRLIGATVHTVEEARLAVAEGPDYLGVGPMFASITKPGVSINGPALLDKIAMGLAAADVALPLVAIGGIDPSNVSELTMAPRSCPCPFSIAVCHAIIGSDHPENATRSLKGCLSCADS